MKPSEGHFHPQNKSQDTKERVEKPDIKHKTIQGGQQSPSFISTQALIS